MQIPDEEFERIINNISFQLCKKYSVPGYDNDDLKQEIALESFKILDRFDEDKGDLASFLFINADRKVKNLIRDKYERNDKPCNKCPFKCYNKVENTCGKYEVFMECELYKKWALRNESKRNVASPISVDSLNNNEEDNALIDGDNLGVMITKELFDTIDKYLPLEFRKDYLYFLDGGILHRSKKKKLISEIKRILKEHDIYE